MPKNENRIPQKSRAWNVIAWIFIVLQALLTPFEDLRSGGSREPIAFFNNLKATVQSIIMVTGMNIPGIGALILGLIVWRYYYNPTGKVTTFVALVIIVLNTLCSFSLVG